MTDRLDQQSDLPPNDVPPPADQEVGRLSTQDDGAKIGESCAEDGGVGCGPGVKPDKGI